MLHPLEEFYSKRPEPLKGCLLYLKDVILNFDANISEEWKYGLPFFYFKGKMFCYFWIDKKTGYPYIGFMKGKFMEHPALILGDRKQVKTFQINPAEDIPIETIKLLLNMASEFY